MKHLLLTTIAAVLVVGTAFADPIHDAVFDGVIARVQAELDKGVDVNTEDEFGFTPLHFAAIKGYKEIAELLIVKEPIYRKPFALYENCNCIATRDNCCQTISKCSIARKNLDASH
ncbi:MAG: ankyrin repeat domain-containing protein [Verrucomicrobia bacterium]|nr:ankyrin repeat domain-containing protein [Verrucomicrobiota bacterium]